MLDERRGVTQVGENQGRISKPASPQRDPHHSSQVLTFDILQSLMADLGFDIDEECKAMSFFELGVTSSELTLITDTLATALQMDLPATMLMDYPVVQDLMIMLDSKRGIGEGEFPRGEGRQPDHIMESEACATKGMWDLPADAAMQGRRTQEWQRGLSDNEQEGPTSGTEDDKEYFNTLAALYARLYGVVSPTSLGLEKA